MSTSSLTLFPAAPLVESLRRKLAPVVTRVSPRRITSHSLLDGARELVIQHQGSEYHLRLTRNDKLILTK